MNDFAAWVPGSGNIILIGGLASLVAGLMTGGGAIPVLFAKTIRSDVRDAMLALPPV
ncbi:hypothetical protein PEL8287_03484 [Roseovarius litorisediminis]|uniref:Uncharacterized protein n=1 Tax=Roseovarius litorisediminis TaxID=1312363 RepID=A0A1Y5TMB9_9RHOB|nr:hypothetical protein [Roseovarius litorisediminis]SLN63694.1 hypothetical protein PEL8287_03484 [Roseovarius litorisediminis]